MSPKKRKSESVDLNIQKKQKCFSEKKLKEIASIFLSNKKNANILVDLLDQFQITSQITEPCIIVVANLFAEVLKRRDMAVTENDNEVQQQYKEWLRGCYEDALSHLATCLQRGTPECKLQALNSMFKLLSQEAKYPIIRVKKKRNKTNFPVGRLQKILHSIYKCASTGISIVVLDRLAEYLQYKDVSCNMWLALRSLATVSFNKQPEDSSVWNILMVMSKLPKSKKISQPPVNLCDVTNVIPEERVLGVAVADLWRQLSRWQYSPRTQQLLLVVLVERMMPLIDNAIYLTDYFMDALARDECEINMLALQGIFNLVLKHNIEYPDIYGKLYQLFTKTALKAKYKTRLFALADEFLRSTHLPLGLVAAFAKRFSRLLLQATPPDMLILLTFIANLLIRHPDLSFLCHKPNSKQVDDDPFVEDEKDPIKSSAVQSQLWEVGLMRHHYCDRVSRLAVAITDELPSAEYELEPLLELTWLQIISKDINLLQKKIPKVAEKFDDKPMSDKMEAARQSEIKAMFADINKYFVLS